MKDGSEKPAMAASGKHSETDCAAGFAAVLAEWPVARVRELIASADGAAVEGALRRETLTDKGLAALLSPAAVPFLEPLARRSATLTRQRFGKVMQFYAPLYVSNVCVNACAYCGFNCRNTVQRKRLSLAAAVREAEYLAHEGFQHLLLVSGEDPHGTPVEYFVELAQRLRGRFASLAIEIYPLSTADYARLVAAGVDSLTVYQETYDAVAYPQFHPAGPKSDFLSRLGAVERGALGGIPFLGIGALLGLGDWRTEIFYVGMHAQYLRQRYWRQHVSVSFPRLRPAAGGFQPRNPVSDADFVQILCALRLFLPDAGLVLSTREPAALRDCLAPLGITRMSAGSRTNPGGYAEETGAEGQFEVADPRSLPEVKAVIERLGLDPICKDWDASYHPPP
jgi:2-iminoacetate synthase